MLNLMSNLAVSAILSSSGVRVSDNPDLADLQYRAEEYVSKYKNNSSIERYELSRAKYRKAEALPPVPVTGRGLKVLTAKGYTIATDGSLVL